MHCWIHIHPPGRWLYCNTTSIWLYYRTAAVGKTGSVLFSWYFSRVCFLVVGCQHACTKPAHATIDLRSRDVIGPRPSRVMPGKTNYCRWWSWIRQVDPWSRRREVAGGALRSFAKPEIYIYIYFCNPRGIDTLCRLFSTHQLRNVCFILRLATEI